MPRKHARLAALLQDAVIKYGGIVALAKLLGLHQREIARLIAGERFVTARQAVKIEAVLRVSARALLIEAATVKIDKDLAAERGA
jgi:plasmid maintenance system antidote protein VapI